MRTLTEIQIEIYRAVDGKSPFLQWLESLKNQQTKDRIDARLNRIRLGNFGDHKELEGGIFELRFFFVAGYRIYFAKEGETIIILLTGGEKGSQKRDIKNSREFYKDYLERKA